MKIVIRAGGTGTRLWPWSTSQCPKQFLPMFDGRSCVQVACERFVGDLVEPEDIYVSVGAAHRELASEQLPELSDEQLIVEPAKMDTAAATGLETIVAAGDDPDVTIASLGSDHYVGKPEAFLEALRAAEEFLQQVPERLLTIACEPTRVETNYGHVKKGEQLLSARETPVYAVEEFTEKPDYATARAYTESGRYLWNANFFVWKSGALMRQFEEFEPDMHEGFMEILSARGTGRFDEILEEKYPQLKKTAIDYAVLEPAAERDRLAVLPVSMGWSDIGSWGSITDAFPPDEDGNLVDGPAIVKNSTNTTVWVRNPGRRLVAAVGVDGLAIVETEDALLVVPRESAADVKELVKVLKESDEYNDLT